MNFQAFTTALNLQSQLDSTVSTTVLSNCMLILPTIPDKFFDVAIVDPPYGIGMGGKLNANSKVKFKEKKWDKSIPKDKYFIELFRISKHQIIWGGNYFPYIWKNGCKDFVFWNKLNHHDNRSDGELAWTSFNGLPKYVEYMWDGNRFGTKGNIQGVGKPTIRIHPTEKPIYIYEWLYKTYCNKNDKIIDTHLGSGSNRIAANKAGMHFFGIEADADYYADQETRYKNYLSQLRLPFI